MEILKHGNTYKKTKCPQCDCEFAYNEADCIEVFNIEGFQETLVFCPECKYAIVDENED